MSDITRLVAMAQDARAEMQSAKKRNKDEVRRKYEATIAREIAQKNEDAEYEFARVLKEVHDAGVPQSTLRREVLRTNVWGEWTKWRDLAEIPPQRHMIRNAKEEAIKAKREAAPYTLRYENGALTGFMDVFRNHRGETILPLAFKFSASAMGNLHFDLADLSRDLDDLADRFGPGVGDSIQNARGFLIDATREAGDYDEMLAWAKAVKK